MSLSAGEIAVIDLAVRIGENTLADDFSIEPVAFIDASVREPDSSVAFGRPGDEVAFVDSTINEFSRAAPVNLAVTPVPRVPVAAGRNVCPVAVLFPFTESAFVNSAVFVFPRPHFQLRLSKSDKWKRNQQSGREPN